jgi:hypothetical protein
MANDINMWNDISELESAGEMDKAYALYLCYDHAFVSGGILEMQGAKDAFVKSYGYWGNYY